MTYRHVVTLAAAWALSGAAAIAAPILAPPSGYPAPGGTSFGSVGSAVTGTSTRTYSGLNDAFYDDLYFGFSAVTGPLASGPANGGAQTLTLSSIGPTEIIWTASSNWQINLASGGPLYVPVQFRSSFFDASNVNITNLAVTGASVGIPTMAVVLQVDGMTSFKVTAAFEAFYNGNWTPITTLYDSLPTYPGCTNCVQSSTTGQFWYTPEAVPEPATLIMLAAGAFAAGRRVRGRRS